MTIEDADSGTGTADPLRPPSSDVEGGSSAKAARPHIPVWQETLILLAIAVVLAVVLKAFFVQAFYLPSESMEPGLVKNDPILVQKVSYWGGGSPERGGAAGFQGPRGLLGAAYVTAP